MASESPVAIYKINFSRNTILSWYVYALYVCSHSLTNIFRIFTKLLALKEIKKEPHFSLNNVNHIITRRIALPQTEIDYCYKTRGRDTEVLDIVV